MTLLKIIKPLWATSVELVHSLLPTKRGTKINEEDAESGSALSPNTLMRKREELSSVLPPDLIAAFNTEPLVHQDPRCVGRDIELALLEEALEEWRQNRGNLTAIIGPHGAGLTTLLNQARGLLQVEEKLTYLSLAHRPCSASEALKAINTLFEFESQPETVAEMVLAINAVPRQVIIIDDGHMLLSRQMGNLAAVQTIGAVLVATQQHHCWFVGCAEQAWRRLTFLYQCDTFFSRIVEINYFTESQLLEIIERRFYGLGYEWAERVGLSEDKTDPMIGRFKRLHDLSNGLLEMAFFFLLYAMEQEESSKVISLQPFSKLDASIVKSCSDDELFSLAEIFVHGVLDHADHESLFRISREQSLLRLERLFRVGILHRIETDEHYTCNSYFLSPILAQVVVSHLIISNKLY